jgi:hypothetical protein
MQNIFEAELPEGVLVANKQSVQIVNCKESHSGSIQDACLEIPLIYDVIAIEGKTVEEATI